MGVRETETDREGVAKVGRGSCGRPERVRRCEGEQESRRAVQMRSEAVQDGARGGHATLGTALCQLCSSPAIRKVGEEGLVPINRPSVLISRRLADLLP